MHNHYAIESCTDIPDCMTKEEIREATFYNECLGILPEHVLHGWPSMKAEVQKELQPYWVFRNEVFIIDGIVMKG